MANFCTNCGAPVAGRFCTACGATAQAPATPAAPAVPAAPAAPVAPAASAAPAAASSGSAVKIVLIVVGALFVMGAMGVASMIYIGYKAKQKITEIARENGIPIGQGALTPAATPTVITSHPQGGGCSVLSGEDVQQILGIAVERVETVPGGSEDLICRYWISLAERRRQATAQIASGVSGISKSDGKEADVNDAARIVAGALTALTTTATSGPDDYTIEVEVTRTGGKEAFEKLLKAQGNVNGATGGFGLQNLEGVGDRAFIIAAGQAVAVLKGDTYMYLSFHQMAPGPEKATEIAKKAVQRM